MERVEWLDLARALALICVVSFHALYELHPDQSLRPLGFLGTSLFFIISGYAIGMRYPKLTGFDGGWLWKRYLRIVIVYYPALIAVYLLFGAQTTDVGWYAVAAHFLFIDFISRYTTYAVISPAWFLVPLIAYYIFYPYINRIIRKFPWMAITAFALSMAFRWASGVWADYSPLFFLCDFVFGICMTYESRLFAYAGSALSVLVNPLMLLPYPVFILVSRIRSKLASGLIRLIARRSLEIFLFHEALIRVLVGRWSVYGQGIVASFIIASIAIAATVLLSDEAGRRLNP